MNGGRFAEGALIAGRYEVRAVTAAAPAYVDYRVFDREVEVELSLWWMDPALWPDPDARAALDAAAREVRALTHPHLRRVFDAGHTPDGAFVVSQIGSPEPTLRRLEAARAGGADLDETDLVRHAAALCEGLQAAHAAGIVHGWLAPVDLVEVGGQIKVSGVGLYGRMDRARAIEAWGEARATLAPEVIEGGPVTARSDVYSAAAILAALAGGRTSGPAAGAIAELLAAAMAPDPARRPASAGDLLARLRRQLIDERVPTARRDVEVPPHAVRDVTVPATGMTPEEMDALAEQTVEESSPLFLHPSAAPSSPLFGPNAPTVLGKRAAPARPPPAVVPAAEAEAAASAGTAPAAHDEGDPLLHETVIEPPDAARGGAPPPAAERVVPLHSRMPVAPEGQVLPTPVVPAIDRPDMQPVLRPLSSVRRPSAPPGSLGNYAPPRDVAAEAATAGRGRRRSGVWLVLALAALAIAGGAVVLVVTSGSRADERARAAAEAAARPPAEPAPPPAPIVKPVEPCPPEMVLVPAASREGHDRPFCVDRHEAPGPGQQPALGLGLEEAQAACAVRGARLCEPAEWEDACRGPDAASFPYGAAFAAGTCNVRGEEIAAAGAFEGCASAVGALDMSGNAAEWDASGAVRGGSALDRSRGRCSDRRGPAATRAARARPDRRADVGYRCCTDALTDPEVP